MPSQIEVLQGLLTTKQVARLFRRSELTAMHWRQHEGLPYVRVPGDGRDTIRYRLDRVKVWAAGRGQEMDGNVLLELEAEPQGGSGGSNGHGRTEHDPYLFDPRPVTGGGGSGAGAAEDRVVLSA